MTACSRDPGG